MNNEYIGANWGPKKVLLWCLVIMTLAFAYGAIRYVGAYGESVSYRSFAVTGEGKVVIVPDVATFNFGVISETSNTEIGKLQSDNATKVNAIIDQLKDLGIDDADLKTQNYSLNPRYQYCGPEARVCPPASIVGYSIEQTVTVKIRDFKNITPALSIAAKAGATNISQLEFSVDDLAAVKTEARAEALKKAQAEAKVLAKAGKFKLGKILSIDEANNYQPYAAKMESAAYGLGGDMAVSLVAPTVEPGSTEVVVNLMVRYSIK